VVNVDHYVSIQWLTLTIMLVYSS